mgnify:CR=1 FL=1
MRALLAFTTRYTAYGSALFLAAMMVLTVIDVGLRATLNLPITGAYDLVQLCLVGTVFLSIPDVFMREDNIVIDLIDHVFGPRTVGALRVIACALAFIFLAVLCWRMFAPAFDAIAFNEVSPDLSISMAVHWTLMILGIAIALPVAAFMLIESILRMLAGTR